MKSVSLTAANANNRSLCDESTKFSFYIFCHIKYIAHTRTFSYTLEEFHEPESAMTPCWGNDLSLAEGYKMQKEKEPRRQLEKLRMYYVF